MADILVPSHGYQSAERQQIKRVRTQLNRLKTTSYFTKFVDFTDHLLNDSIDNNTLLTANSRFVKAVLEQKAGDVVMMLMDIARDKNIFEHTGSSLSADDFIPYMRRFNLSQANFVQVPDPEDPPVRAVPRSVFWHGLTRRVSRFALGVACLLGVLALLAALSQVPGLLLPYDMGRQEMLARGEFQMQKFLRKKTDEIDAILAEMKDTVGTRKTDVAQISERYKGLQSEATSLGNVITMQRANLTASIAELSAQLAVMQTSKITLLDEVARNALNDLKEALDSHVATLKTTQEDMLKVQRDQVETTHAMFKEDLVSSAVKMDEMKAALESSRQLLQAAGGHVEQCNLAVLKTREDISKLQIDLQDVKEKSKPAVDASKALQSWQGQMLNVFCMFCMLCVIHSALLKVFYGYEFMAMAGSERLEKISDRIVYYVRPAPPKGNWLVSLLVASLFKITMCACMLIVTFKCCSIGTDILASLNPLNLFLRK